MNGYECMTNIDHFSTPMTYEQTFRIGELADEFDISLRALRFYEDKGLITPRRLGNTRLYSRADRARLSLIILGKRLGFALDDIGTLLDLYEPDGTNLAQLTMAADMGAAQLERLEEEKATLNASIGELHSLLADVRSRIESGQTRT